MNACGHDGDGTDADMGDGRTRRLCARCTSTLRPPEPRLLTRDECEKASTQCPACPKCKCTAGTQYEAGPVLESKQHLICAACGEQWVGTAEEMAKAAYADAAYDRLLSLDNMDADEHDRHGDKP